MRAIQLLTRVIVGVSLVIALVGCNSQLTDPVDSSSETLSANKKDLCEKGQCPCDSPMGSIAHGAGVTIYSVAKVSCDQSCGNNSKQITCSNGKFSEDISKSFFSCQATECSACSIGSTLVPHGDSIDTYSTNEVDCNQSCEDVKVVRQCNNGKLLGDAGHTQVACQTRVCRCRLPDNISYLSLGGKADLYNTQVAACGTTCADARLSRTCTSTGTGASRTFALSGADSFKYGACEESSNCFCTLPDGKSVLNHLETTVLNKAATVTCGQTCADQGEVRMQCKNGKLFNFSDSSAFDSATTAYKYRCQATACRVCTLPDGSKIEHGSSTYFFKTKTPTCSVKCYDLSNALVRKCNDGTFDGDATFSSQTCTDKTPCYCDVPSSTEKVPVGGTRLFYSADRATCSQSCTDLSLTRTCLATGAFDGGATFAKTQCGSSVGCTCTLPSGATILDKARATISSAASVACGQSCDSVSIDVVCESGTLKNAKNNEAIDVATSVYKFACAAVPCKLCAGADGSFYSNGTKKYFFKNSAPTCATKCYSAANGLQRECKDGAWLGDAAYASETCTDQQQCSCEIPDQTGVFFPVGETRSFYKSNKATCDTSCAQMITSRTCAVGPTTTVLTGPADYKSSTCTAATGCTCTLPNGLGVIQHGTTTKLAPVGTASCGQTCAKLGEVEVRCDAGKLYNVSTNALVTVATTNLKYQCQAVACKVCKRPDGSLVEHGTSSWFYKAASPVCGVNCEDAGQGVKRTCNNGVFNGDTSFTLGSCKERAPCSCTIDGYTLAVSESHTYYSAPKATCGTPCAAMSLNRKCKRVINGRCLLV